MKDVIVAGDTLDNAYTVVDFPPSAGWTLRFRLIPHVAGPPPIDITAFTDPGADRYLVQLGPSTTSGWQAGDYALTRWVETGGARYNVETDPELPKMVVILPDPAYATVFDGRSDARKNLEAIETYMGGKPTAAIQEYEIAGRRLVNYKPAELIQLADYFRRQVANEDRTAALANSLGNPRHLYIRFGRP